MVNTSTSNIAYNNIYRKAFNEYLRQGTPIEITLQELLYKAQQPTTHYVWRTRSDDKVRSSHAANNGKIFAYDNPPETGNPGDDYGCRCIAEPYYARETEYAYQELISVVNDNLAKWILTDFVAHAFGEASDITLQQIGHLKDIINHYGYVVNGGVFKNVNQQIIEFARSLNASKITEYFYYSFDNSYDFRPVSYPHGDAIIGGKFSGYVSNFNNRLHIYGEIDYYFDDEYTDPVDIRQILNDGSDPELVSELWRLITDGGGKNYKINDNWTTKFVAEINANPSESNYQ